MEKQTIVIRKIKDNQFWERLDEVALEQEFEIVLQSGEKLHGFCTPTYMEEMILGSRFLAGDLTKKELKEYDADGKKLAEVGIQEIFRVAEECFEHPGSLFADTGCAHSCALVCNGRVLCQMEDIGRYNALDKVIGYAVMNGISFKDAYVFTSGRVSVGYITKVYKAGFPMVVSRAAVTKAAVEFAKEHSMTLVGFIRKNTGNVYNEGNVKLNEQSI